MEPRDLVQIVLVITTEGYSVIGMSEKVTEDRIDKLRIDAAMHLIEVWTKTRLRMANAKD